MYGPQLSLKSQRGVSLSGLIVFFGIAIVIAMVALKVFPLFLEYRAAKGGIESAKATRGSPAEMRAAFDKNADINAVTTISGRDLIIYKTNNETEVAFDYEPRVPLFTNVALMIRFAATTDKSGVIPDKPEVAPR